MKAIDNFLNGITMYRLVLKGLGYMAIYAIIMSLLGFISYDTWSLIMSLATISITALIVNWILAKLYKANLSNDSTLITALILFFILIPTTDSIFSTIIITSAVIASKYVIAYKQRHIFNPVAIGAFITGFLTSGSAIWWVGSSTMLIAVIILAFLVVRKTRRFALFYSAVGASFIAVVIVSLIKDILVWEQISSHILSWPIIFFASIMVTEPLSTPPTRKFQIIYGLLVGALSATPFHFGPVYGTPELALIIGNIFTFAVGMRERIILVLKEKKLIAKDTYEFIFEPNHKLHFIAGQYLEYVLPHEKPDDRGMRRYFTIASSPTELELKLGIRMAPSQIKSSSFKEDLLSLTPGSTLTASRLAGDFTLPSGAEQKLVFIAGGIGITPFRSMIKFLLDSNMKRDITLFYANKTKEDIAYSDIWARAEREMGLKLIHVLSEGSGDWQGERGFITEAMVKKYVNSYHDARYYISGPSAMVEAYKKLLIGMGVSRHNIVTDYFPGFV